MLPIIVNFISLFCTYVTIFKRKNVSLIYENIIKFGRIFDKLITNSALKAVNHVKHHLK